VIIEDKTGLKKNSLFGNNVEQTQDSIENFSDKIRGAKDAQVTEDFMVIARIESLILQAGMQDALTRATAYIEAGADGIMIHSRECSPKEIIEFCTEYMSFPRRVPLIAVPSSYNVIMERELEELGVNVVIYANQLLRAAYPAMLETAKSILKNGRSFEIDSKLLSISEIIELIPGSK
jgi:phosphoenolpyruvate phosphomutase